MHRATVAFIMGAAALASSAQASPRLLDLVNRQENAAHAFGAPRPEDHTLGPWRGTWHCTSYAYAKLERLRDVGFPISALRVVAVHTEHRDAEPIDHAVLLVDTADDGEWVLDNRYLYPERRADLERVGYRFTDQVVADGAAPMQQWQAQVSAGAYPR